VAVRYLIVIRERGPAWVASLAMREQDGWQEHGAFMNTLAEQGFVRIGGPLGEDEQQFLLVVDADGEAAARERLAQDPWERSGLLTVASVTPWEILLLAGPDAG
jgi:uncharacterized protein YciI